jgi:hypothetical protein
MELPFSLGCPAGRAKLGAARLKDGVTRAFVTRRLFPDRKPGDAQLH